jgi:hypothetical protein
MESVKEFIDRNRLFLGIIGVCFYIWFMITLLVELGV